MADEPDDGFLVRPQRVALAMGLATALLGAVVLVAWVTDTEALKQIRPGWQTLKANAALGFLGCGAALMLASSGRPRWAAAPAALAIALGALTLVQYVAGVDLGIDELLFEDEGTAGTQSPGRMAILTAANFVLLGLALASWTRPTRAATAGTLVASFIALLNIAFYLFGAVPPVEAGRMAVHTAFGFLLVSTGITVGRPGLFADLALGRSSSSRLARQLLVPVILLPFVFGWLANQSVRAGYLDPYQAHALALLADLTILLLLIGLSLARLHRETRQRAAAEAAERAAARQAMRANQRSDEAERATGRGSWEWDVTADRAVWSPGMYRLFGVDQATFVNSNENFLAMVHPDDRDRMGQAMADALARPGRFLQEYRLTRPDGSLRYLRGEGNVATGPDGAAAVVHGVVQDVTDLRALEEEARRAQASVTESEKRLATIFRATPAGLILTRADGTVVEANPGAELLWGLSREEFLSPAFNMRQLYADPSERAKVIERIRTQGAVRDLELRMLRKGAVRTMLFNAEMLSLGGEPVFLGSGTDITPLREAEQRFRALFEANPVALALSKADGSGIVDVNPAYERLLGYTRAEILAPAFDPAVIWHDPSGRQALLSALRSAGGGDGIELELRRKDGGQRSVVLSARTVDVGGVPCFLVGLQDVSEAKAAQLSAQRARERFERVFESSPAAISLTKDDGRILDVNPAFVQLTGYERTELVETIGAAQLYEDPMERQRLLASLRERGVVRDLEIRVRRKDGAVRTVLASLEFVDVGGSTTILGLYQDITERKRAQADRERHIAEEAELERLRRTDQFRTEFINSTAHELKTPLTPLLLGVAALKHQLAGQDKAMPLVQSMERSAERLRRVVADMVAAADLQARTITLEKRRLNVTRQLKAAVAGHAAAAHRANLTLAEPEESGLAVLADEARLQLVLGHLLGNAIKFTPAGGRVWLTAVRQDEWVRIEVHDTGVGLTSKEMEALWKPYSQAHDKSQRTDSGSGLGLYVSKGIVELHGGTVGVSSAGPAQGSTFWFTLPLAVGNVDPLWRNAPEAGEREAKAPRRNLNPTVREDE